MEILCNSFAAERDTVEPKWQKRQPQTHALTPLLIYFLSSLNNYGKSQFQ